MIGTQIWMLYATKAFNITYTVYTGILIKYEWKKRNRAIDFIKGLMMATTVSFNLKEVGTECSLEGCPEVSLSS